MTRFFEKNLDHGRIDLFNNQNNDILYSHSQAPSSARKSLITVHLIEQDVGLRARIARRLVEAGFHTEIYAETNEFAAFAPKDGVILIDDANHPSGLPGMTDDLGSAGAGMAIIVFCDKPTIKGVVAAMKARAINYLSLDMSDVTLSKAIREASQEGVKAQAHQTQVANCRKLIANLSQREREVLDFLVEGESNKGIGRLLKISPRTVEIHRMKMLSKLGVKSPAAAVRIWFQSNPYF
ncbi:response regulator transcription factor [Novosphingobium sp.]|uniref:response regulator transcription factor n=1 Tax=Novosphingobium sp. TaxID=1874826 RepID=UPI003D113589